MRQVLSEPTNNSQHTQADLRERIQRATATLAKLEGFLNRQAYRLREACTEQGKFQSVRLDDHQQHAYDLALAYAALEAAKVMQEFAQDEASSELDLQCAILFIAESVDELLHKLSRLAADRQDAVHELRCSTGLQEILSLGLDPKFQAALGMQLSQQGINSLRDVLGAEKRMMRETFERFARDEVAPVAEEIHRQDLDIPEALLNKAADLGCFGTSIPERFGGLQPDEGADSLGMIVVTEVLSTASLGAAGSLITRPEIAARALLAGGTEAQQDKWLPRLASGDSLCAIAITEPDTGSDVASVALRAKAADGGWLLNGAKTWCTFAGRSDLLLVLARTGGDDRKGHQGLSLFLVEKPAYSGHSFSYQQEQGELTGTAIATLGYRGMHSYDLFFSDFFVPADSLIGGEEGIGRGFYYTMAGFAGGRIQTAARATGVMQAAFNEALAYTQQRRVFGQALAEYQLTQIKLARMLATISAARLFSYRVAELLDAEEREESNKSRAQMSASLVKLFACRAAEWVCREAMQLHGGLGYAEESPVSRYFVDARVLSIFEGAEEVLAIKVVARELIASAEPAD